MYRCVISAVLVGLVTAKKPCSVSVTTASGSIAPSKICSGDLIFQEEFNSLSETKWQHENTLAGGGNWEFQWYTNNRSNSFIDNGVLCIKPTLTADDLGYSNLYTDTLDLNQGPEKCTNADWYGCRRTGTSEHILNPIKSARISTINSFSFTYGILKVRAKMPSGDWIWPAIWMLPHGNVYGSWPASGEIDIIESRGNRELILNDKNIGVQLMGSTLHWGPDFSHNGYEQTHWEKSNSNGFNNNFHLYEVRWTPSCISFYVDEEKIGGVCPTSGGFWSMGGWDDAVPNPWSDKGVMAPFNQDFYIIINNAVGGVNHYFPDQAINKNGKPWRNNSTRASTDFWESSNSWLHTWNLNKSKDAALQIDYVRVYAL